MAYKIQDNFNSLFNKLFQTNARFTLMALRERFTHSTLKNWMSVLGYWKSNNRTAFNPKKINWWNLTEVIENDPTYYIQQNRAPLHWVRSIREFLDTQFPSQWIGKRGPIEWLARSPDLRPLDFFVWGPLNSEYFENSEFPWRPSPKKLLNAKNKFVIILGANLSSNFFKVSTHFTRVWL